MYCLYNAYMPLTILLAQLFGLLLIVKGLFILLRTSEVQKMLRDTRDNRPLLYAMGIASTFFGLILTLSHNTWSTTPEVFVSAIGWITLLKGIVVLFSPHTLLNLIRPITSSHTDMRSFGSIAVLIGFYLVYVGFGF